MCCGMHFKGQRPEVLRLLELIETWRMWVLCDREPVKNWSQGPRDAAGRRRAPDAAISGARRLHGDRGCRVLAEKVAASARRPAGRVQGLSAGSAICAPARVQIMARVYGEFYHARGVTAELRDMAIGSRTVEQSYDGIAWLYGGP